MATESRAQAIARVMATMGFRPKAEIDAYVRAYYKDYAEGTTRIARATVLFRKGFMGGIDNAALDGIQVSVMDIIPPEQESVMRDAPQVMQADLVTTLRELGNMEPPSPEAVVTQQCGKCHDETPEFFVDEAHARVLCRNCWTQVIGSDRSG